MGDPSGEQAGTSRSDPAGWRREGRNLLQAVAAGSIFGMPLLYTMEMWFHGMTFTVEHLLLVLAAGLVINFGFSYLSGFRDRFDLLGALADAITSVGLGIVIATAILLLIGRLSLGAGPSEVLAKILIEAVAVSIGVSFANLKLGGEGRNGDEGPGGDRSGDSAGGRAWRQLNADLRDAGATIAGATVFAFSVAPTDEVVRIGAGLRAWQHLILLAAEIGLCHVILYASGFRRREVERAGSAFQRPWAETVMCVALSLVVALVLLYLVGNRQMLGHPSSVVAATLALGLPATVGGAAGRLVV